MAVNWQGSLLLSTPEGPRDEAFPLAELTAKKGQQADP